MILVLLSLAWLGGTAAGYYLSLHPVWLLLSMVPVPVFWLVRSHRKAIIVVIFSLLLFTGAVLHTDNAIHQIDERVLRFHNDRGVMLLTGTVSEPPDVRERSTRLTFNVEEVCINDEVSDVKGKALVFVPRYPEYRYGDVLSVRGELLTPSQLDEFDYAGYLAGQGISSVVYYPYIEVIDTGGGLKLFSWIYSMRESLAASLSRALPEPQASLAQGLLLGIRGGIPENVSDAFSRSGAAHLLAISGLHLGVMAGILLGLGVVFFGRHRHYYIFFALAGILCYAVISGLNPPVVRGAIMASLFLWAEALGRQRSGFVALCLAAAVMTACSPHILSSVSFQMSFLAMTGLVFIYPLLRQGGRSLVSRLATSTGSVAELSRFFIDTLAATLAAVLATWPVTVYYFGFVSLAGIPATFLCLPALPFIVIAATLSSAVGLALPVLGQVLGWLAWPFLSWMLMIVSWLGSSESAVITASISPWMIAIYYVLAALLLIGISRWQRHRLATGTAGFMRAGIDISLGFRLDRRWLLLPLALLAVITSAGAVSMPDDDCHVSFLDVGQGDAIFVSKGSRQVLIDGGPNPQLLMQALGKRMPFWDRTIELVVLTHAHEDHLAGLVEVLRRYQVNNVIVPPYDHNSNLYREWKRLIEEHDVAVTVGCTGQQVVVSDSVTLTVLSPQSGMTSDIETTTLVLRLDAGNTGFLFTSDINGDIERELVRQRVDIKADILKVAHHGARDSTTAEFFAVVRPSLAIISCGEGNRFEHPHEEALLRLGEAVGQENVYRTDIVGDVDFICNRTVLYMDTPAG